LNSTPPALSLKKVFDDGKDKEAGHGRCIP
jgi:hypothetical protein